MNVTTPDQIQDSGGPRPDLLRALRDSGDDRAAAVPSFDVRAAAARLRTAAEIQGFIGPADDPAEAQLVAAGRHLEDAAPPFEIEAAARCLRDAARDLLTARGPGAGRRPQSGRGIYRLLGDLEIGREDQRRKLPPGPRLAILAALLINANHRLSQSSLVTTAWGNREITEAQLHKSVAGLRSLLAQIGRERDLIAHPGFGYEIRVADDDLDMLRFQRLVRQAEQARSRGRATDEIAALREALALWRGPRPLATVPGDAFRLAADGLEQRRRRAAARLFDLELARHHHDRIRGELTLIAAEYPADSHLAGRLMIVAYRCGRTADAAATCQRHADAVALQMGGGPDRVLRDLDHAIACDDETAVAAAESILAAQAGEGVEESASRQAEAMPGAERTAVTVGLMAGDAGMVTVGEVAALAILAHNGQKLSFGAAYSSHLRMVVETMRPFGPVLEMAGWLHDILEMTEWTASDLRAARVPDDVVKIVERMTHTPGTDYLDTIRLITQDPEATLVKIADNADSIRPELFEPTRFWQQLLDDWERARVILWSATPDEDVIAIVSRVNPSLLGQQSADQP